MLADNNERLDKHTLTNKVVRDYLYRYQPRCLSRREKPQKTNNTPRTSCNRAETRKNMSLPGHEEPCDCDSCLDSEKGPRTVTGYAVSGDFLITYYKNVVIGKPNFKLVTRQVDTAVQLAAKHIGKQTGIPGLRRQFMWQSVQYMLCVYEDDPYQRLRGCSKRSDLEHKPEFVTGLPLLQSYLVEQGAIQPNAQMSDYQVFRAHGIAAVAAEVPLWKRLVATPK
ncbi:hypothetical protein SISNIDRAFT_489200 [Sistotremastrum niveocremeum HHB9708]|uniref:Uncharacterized protein n=1 Tax=Sistotremastrum niveocremeum HHB9708 TaxID=1314777 RepID=A0A164QBP2_9AGAM|nr:hypothetical protein SISNIDRAFT_489200 [Sistotremastrum niveocremeum HHB9708]